jgi:O-antigen biosynthesis protein
MRQGDSRQRPRAVVSRLGQGVRRELHGRSIVEAAGDLSRLLTTRGWRGVAERTGISVQRRRPPGSPPSDAPVLDHRVGSYAWNIACDPYFDLTPEELEANATVVGRFEERPRSVTSATWFLPRFEHALFGGVYTILRLMSWMREYHGVEHRLVLFDGLEATDPRIRAMVREAFPNLADIDIVLPHRTGLPLDELPPTDIAVCSLWSSAYALARYNATGAKFYMVQDFEPSFYPAGTAYALAEATYRLGYAGLVNTPGLADVYAAYGNPTISFVPAVDFAVPDLPKPSAQGQPVQIVLYGRPSTDRNAFELIAVACRQLKARYGDRIRIVSAGEDYDPAAFGLEGVLENVGLLRDLHSVRTLYAESDVGICFMLSKHPSYQPFEYLAARMAPVCNANAATGWLLRDGENCLITEPFPSCVAEAVGRLVDDSELRLKIASGGHEDVVNTTWERELQRTWQFITNQPVENLP